MRIALVACSSSRSAEPAPAEERYDSPLFRARRQHVAGRCDRWFVLSPRYGLVEPGRIVSGEPRRLTELPAAERRRWATAVLLDLDLRVGGFDGVTVELHAGAAYCDSGLASGLSDRGATVERPVAGLGQGRQLAWYRAQDTAAAAER